MDRVEVPERGLDGFVRKKGLFRKVIGIWPETVLTLKANGDEGNSSPSFVEPIPLTATILKDWFGRKPEEVEGWVNCWHFVHRLYIYLNDDSFTASWLLDGTMYPLKKGKYVHELQRLVHALTGSPLQRIETKEEQS